MKYTFKQFQEEYPTDEACLDKIMERRYGGTAIACPACGVATTKFHRMTKRRAYACQECGHHIYPCVGTPFEKSRTKLTLWFFAMYLMTTTRHGVAAKELERQLGVTYKTAWRMAHELRKHMAGADFAGPLSGHVEMDETYVGGKHRGRRSRGRGMHALKDKTAVFGMLQRDGGGVLRAGVVENGRRKTVLPLILSNVQRGSVVSTDEGPAYKSLAKEGPYEHEAVNHRADEYVRGIHHVNGIEGFWGHFKKGIKGTNVGVSRKHMWKYVAEYQYRYNFRDEGTAGLFKRLVLAFQLPRQEVP